MQPRGRVDTHEAPEAQQRKTFQSIRSEVRKTVLACSRSALENHHMNFDIHRPIPPSKESPSFIFALILLRFVFCGWLL